MDAWQALTDVVLLLAGGFVLGALAERLRQSAILGYLTAGLLLGPHALHWVRTQEQVSTLAELGVALLLFSIGLEFSWERLKRTGGAGFGGGAVQVVLTMALGTAAAALAGLPPRAAVVMGAIVALSSTAYVLRVLYRRAEIDSLHGRAAVGVLLLQDMAVVPLVLLVSVLQGGGSPLDALAELGRLLGFALLLVVGSWIVFRHLVPRVLGIRVLERNRELPLLLAVASGLGSAMGAHALGLSPAIGAFLAGIMLGESPFATQIRADVGALRTVLMMLFFGSIGMMGDVGWIASNLVPVAALVLAVVVGKTLLTAVSLRLVRVPRRTAWAAALCLAQIGEFSFILAELARGEFFSDEVFQLVVSTTIATLFLTPYLIRFAPDGADRLTRLFGRRGDSAPSEAPGTIERHAVVVGFGPTGRAVAEALSGTGLEVHVVELNRRSLQDAARLGFVAHAGDATHPEVLEHAAVTSAAAVVVTLPDSRSARRVVEQVRALAPGARLFVRGRYHVDCAGLEQAGAHVVVDEEAEVGRALALALLAGLQGVGADRAREP